MKGKIKTFNEEKGYGFIRGEDGKDIFVHLSEIHIDSGKIKKGDTVEFEYGVNKWNGEEREQAVNVTVINKSKKSHEQEEYDITKDSDSSDGKSQSNDLTEEERKALQDVIDKEKKESFWQKLKKIAVAVIKAPVTYLIIKPVNWINDKITLAFMPKESRTRMYDEAVRRAYEEQEQEKKNLLKEDAHTISMKMQIIRDKKLNDVEQMKELAKLCHDTKKNITVKTELGAFLFENVGNTVLIKHATPKKRTQESEISYEFKTVGGMVFDRFGMVKEKETDIFDAVKQLRMDKGFDIHERELDPKAVKEDSLIVDMEPESSEGTKVNLNKNIDNDILAGNDEQVMETVMEAIDTPDYVSYDEIIGEQTETSSAGLEPMEALSEEELAALIQANREKEVAQNPTLYCEPDICPEPVAGESSIKTAHYSKGEKLEESEEYATCYEDPDDTGDISIGRMLEEAAKKAEEHNRNEATHIIDDEQMH